MAKGRVRNRMELRAQAEAAARLKQEESDVEEEEDEEGGDEEESEQEEEAVEGEVEEGEEEAPRKRKPAAKPAKARPRKAPKVVRMKAVWGVFNNSNQRVAVFEYPRRKEAEEHAAKLSTDKKSTFFVQLVKEPLEEKKD